MSIKLKIFRLDSSVSLPKYATKGDAGFDLCSSKEIVINPGELVSIPTGLMMEIPLGYVGLIWDKGGLSHKHGLKTFGGVVDAGYRGEVLVGIKNFGDKAYTFEKNHKVAQMLIQKCEDVEIVETKEQKHFSDSERGEGKYGSTGK